MTFKIQHIAVATVIAHPEGEGSDAASAGTHGLVESQVARKPRQHPAPEPAPDAIDDGPIHACVAPDPALDVIDDGPIYACVARVDLGFLLQDPDDVGPIHACVAPDPAAAIDYGPVHACVAPDPAPAPIMACVARIDLGALPPRAQPIAPPEGKPDEFDGGAPDPNRGVY